MRTWEIDLPPGCNAQAAPTAVERALANLSAEVGAHASRRLSLRTLPGSLHWHIRRRGERGTLEATYWPAKNRLWLSVQAGRRGEWIEAVVEQLRTQIAAALARPSPSAGRRGGSRVSLPNMLIARYIFFTPRMAEMVAFYTEVLGLKQVKAKSLIHDDPAEWVQLTGGGFEVALHRASSPGCAGRNRNKLAFHTKDVTAARDALVASGVKIVKSYTGEQLQFCDFKDPDGNLLQISSR